MFGQLDFETVHFVWDSAIWLVLCLVLTRFARGNRWLWVAFCAASMHEVEHLYLFWIYNASPWFYAHGGLEGIMGSGGLIGSPLARPYLHFTYNFLVVVPMVCAFLDQTQHVHDGGPADPAARGDRDNRGRWRTRKRRRLSSAAGRHGHETLPLPSAIS